MAAFRTGSQLPLPLAALTLPGARVAPGHSTLRFAGAGHDLTLQALESHLGLHVAIHVTSGPFADHQSIRHYSHGTPWPRVLGEIVADLPPCLRLDGAYAGSAPYDTKCYLSGRPIKKDSPVHKLDSCDYLPVDRAGGTRGDGVIGAIRAYMAMEAGVAEELEAARKEHAAAIEKHQGAHVETLRDREARLAAAGAALKEATGTCDSQAEELGRAATRINTLRGEIEAATKRANEAEAENAILREQVRQGALAMTLLQRPRDGSAPAGSASSSGIPDDVSAVTVRTAPSGSWAPPTPSKA
jgi:hypothetical protein